MWDDAVFIVFEGIDGSGKSIIIKKLKDKLEASKKKVIVTAEPTGGKIGKIVADTESFTPECEALLFTADRIDHIKKIQEWISQGYDVLCDRYIGSTLAYQSAAGVDLNWLKAINSKITIKPDVTILMDIDPKISLERKKGVQFSRFENLDYLKKVREAYLDIANDFKFIKIDANKDLETILKEIMLIILSYRIKQT